MKTLEQVLESVTAGGAWKLGKNGYTLWEADERFLMVGRLDIKADAAYAARACANFPVLVRALDLCATCLCGDIRKQETYEANEAARNALAEALKD